MSNKKEDKPEGMLGLSAVRRALGLSRPDLARLTGHHPSSIANWENGLRHGTVPGLRDMAEALGCDPADLMAVPSEARLAQIKANRSERKAAEDRANADALSAGGAQ